MGLVNHGRCKHANPNSNYMQSLVDWCSHIQSHLRDITKKYFWTKQFVILVNFQTFTKKNFNVKMLMWKGAIHLNSFKLRHRKVFFSTKLHEFLLQCSTIFFLLLYWLFKTCLLHKTFCLENVSSIVISQLRRKHC